MPYLFPGKYLINFQRGDYALGLEMSNFRKISLWYIVFVV